MSLRKIFSIVIASLAFYLFINMFFQYNGLVNEYNDIAIVEGNMWSFSVGFSIFALISIISIITLHLLYLFGVVNEKWISYTYFGVGFVALFHVCYLFLVINATGFGIWIGFFASILLLASSILWGFLSDKTFAKEEKGKITGYDPKTGRPIYAKPKGFDPETGKPIYE